MSAESRWRRRLTDERGSTLVLFPAALLILLGLGAMALDAATIYLGQRRLVDLAAATANDAAGGLDLDSFYTEGQLPRLDPELGRERAQTIAALMGEDRSFEDVACQVHIDGLEATATCTAQIRPILAPVWAGSAERLDVRAVEVARAVGGDGGW